MVSGKAARGERKRELLGYLMDEGELTTSELLERVEITRTTVRRHMNRYRRHGDVEIEAGGFLPGAGGQDNTYRLTERGREKVRYYRSEDS